MEASKVITYSLLAQIRNSGNFVNSSVEIFVPIVKYALYKLITQSGVYKGASITEISTWICQYFGLDFPPAVLEKILLKIGQEINTSEELKLQVYRDGSFWIKNYSFEEFNDIYETNRQQVELVLENPLKVVPLIHSNLTPVKFSHSPFCLFLFSSYSSCPLCRVLH